MQTFGWNLLQFARSVDNLQPDVVDGMKELISDYLLRKDGLDACYFCVHRTGASFEGVPALNTVWSSEEESDAQVVRRFKNKKNSESPSLRALAYNEDRCLWVTSNSDAEGKTVAGGATLDQTGPDGLIDQWRSHNGENATPLPPYVQLHDHPCRTLMALPLAHHGQKLGVLVVEFERQIPLTEGARREAELFRRALGRILWLQDAASSQQDGTRKAFEQLKNVVTESGSSIDPPMLFLAYPKHSDPGVSDSIKQVIEANYGERIKLVSWDAMAAPGQITDQLVGEISRCRYGICYLSEVVESSAARTRERRFVDNSNVLIEAGMLYALRNSLSTPTSAWIPIREADELTVPMPFDFVAERMIIVPRDARGKLQKEAFEALFKHSMDAMLEN